MKKLLAGLLSPRCWWSPPAAGAAARRRGPAARPKEVTLTLNWYPYGEHAPFYYGVKQGIFAKARHRPEDPGGPGFRQDRPGRPRAGQTDFGWADTSALATAVDQGVPVKSVGVFLQTTPASVQFFADKNIKKPAGPQGQDGRDDGR